MKQILILSSLLLTLPIFAETIFSIHEGDSITRGYGSTGGSNYVFQMSQRDDASPLSITYTNLGLDGDYMSNNVTATNVLWHLSNAPASSRSIVTLMMGDNDIRVGDETYQSVTTNMLGFITNVYASFPSVKIVLLTITAFSSGEGTDKGVTKTNINNWIRSNAPVDLVVDVGQNPFLTPWNTTYYDDGVHPNNLGYLVIATNVFNAMLGAGLLNPSSVLNSLSCTNLIIGQ